MLSTIRRSCVTQSCLVVYLFISIEMAYSQFVTIRNIPPDPNVSEFEWVGSDTQLNLIDEGIVGRFFSAGATDGTSSNVEVNIFGGMVGDFFSARTGSVVNISGGVVGRFFKARAGSEVNISGGDVHDRFSARTGSEIKISGGNVGGFFDADPGSRVDISGGAIAGDFNAWDGSVVNISGGTVGSRFEAFEGSVVNLIGRQFVLDSVDITDSLMLDVPFTIRDRDVSLAGLLTDGSSFRFDLNSLDEYLKDYFDPSATLTVTLTTVPEPATCMLFITTIVGAMLIWSEPHLRT